MLGRDPATFFTFDFFMHETQATSVVASSKPQFNTVVQVRGCGACVCVCGAGLWRLWPQFNTVVQVRARWLSRVVWAWDGGVWAVPVLHVG